MGQRGTNKHKHTYTACASLQVREIHLHTFLCQPGPSAAPNPQGLKEQGELWAHLEPPGAAPGAVWDPEHHLSAQTQTPAGHRNTDLPQPEMKRHALENSVFQYKHEAKSIQGVLGLVSNKTRINFMGISLKITFHSHFYAGRVSDVQRFT